jgi:hypothetical protein
MGTWRSKCQKVAAGLLVAGLLACSSSASPEDTIPPIEASRSGLHTALAFLAAAPDTDPVTLDLLVKDLPPSAINLADLRRGGPPPDGIPPIDNPLLIPTSKVDFLVDSEPVIAIEINGDARAYPIQILIWHEIVNDEVGNTPVTVTYCPLCNSALAYERTVMRMPHNNDQEPEELILDFGTSGLLLNSSLVMFDRCTETLWSHFTAEAVHGTLVGSQLTTLPVAMVPWGTWRSAHPDGLVLSTDTGFERDYGQNPYPGYDTSPRPFLFQGEVDGQLSAMTRIVGISLTDTDESSALALPLVTLVEDQVIHTELAGTDLVMWWVPGMNSALNLHDIVFSKDVGSVGVFSPLVDGLHLSFQPKGDSFIDEQTTSTWNALGHAIQGPLTGQRLERIEHLDTFWFAWAAFWPDTVIWR